MMKSIRALGILKRHNLISKAWTLRFLKKYRRMVEVETWEELIVYIIDIKYLNMEKIDHLVIPEIGLELHHHTVNVGR